MNIETLISLGYYVSSIGFLIASIVVADAVKKSGASSMRTVLRYLFIGTAVFFLITVFQKLGAEFFGISDASVDIWWHLMFYLAMISYYFSFSTLAAMGRPDMANKQVNPNAGKVWGIVSAIIVVIIFIIPSSAEPWVLSYLGSRFADLGAHHFIAFAMGGIVGAYLLSAKIFLGQIGRAIASPMIIAIWALSLQHLWELFVESWKIIVVGPGVGEGVEKIFLTIAAVCVIYSAVRIKALAKSV